MAEGALRCVGIPCKNSRVVEVFLLDVGRKHCDLQLARVRAGLVAHLRGWCLGGDCVLLSLVCNRFSLDKLSFEGRALLKCIRFGRPIGVHSTRKGLSDVACCHRLGAAFSLNADGALRLLPAIRLILRFQKLLLNEDFNFFCVVLGDVSDRLAALPNKALQRQVVGGRE